MRGKTHTLKVWGDLACFTRPEMKVERYSYPVITPSAARGVFDAIYFKKSYGFYWQIEQIEILQAPQYIALRRNEVKDKAPSHTTIQQWMQGKKPPQPLWADGTKADFGGSDQKGRTQRQTMALKNVIYRIQAHMCFRDETQNPATMDAQFERRAKRGQCFYQPFLGCREFPAWFELLSDSGEEQSPVELDIDLGWMLYDVFDLGQNNSNMAKPAISVFHAFVQQGTLAVPPYGSNAVQKTGEEYAR